jgi:DNA-binding NtrC family response regulator
MEHPLILIPSKDEVLRQDLLSVLRRYDFAVSDPSEQRNLVRFFRKRTLDLVILFSPGVPSESNVADDENGSSRGGKLIHILAGSSDGKWSRIEIAGVDKHFDHSLSRSALLRLIDHWLSDPLPLKPQPNTQVRVGHLVEGSQMLGESPTMQEIRGSIQKVASSDSNVLITGETGTGKEMVAELIHKNSLRRAKPLVCINCAAIPDTLLESELFGHERGAFTGADFPQEGKLKSADGGTVFFDEIGDMSPHAQAKILRLIEIKQAQRLGSKASFPLNIRIIAATNRDVDSLVKANEFRKDLYFRLNVVRLQLPPLRERKEDIPLLINHYVEEMNRSFGCAVEGFTQEAFDSLLRYDWPGNIRELKNLLEAIFVNLPQSQISVNDFPEPFRRHLAEIVDYPQDERDRLLAVLFATNWNKSKAAHELHWSRMTIYRKIAKYHINRSEH